MSTLVRNVIKTFIVNGKTPSRLPILTGSNKYLHMWNGRVVFTMLLYCWCICSGLPIAYGFFCLEGEDGVCKPWRVVDGEFAVHRGGDIASIPLAMSETIKVVFCC